MLRANLLRRCSNKIKVIECPRDAMQGLHKFVPTEQKIRYHSALLKCGYDTLDCVSFVPPRAVPQLRDSEEVLEKIAPLVQPPTKLLAVVANVRGCVKALKQPRELKYIGYPLSASETFQQKNTNRDIKTALQNLEEMQQLIAKHNTENNDTKELVTYISMAFGNPYRDPFSADEVLKLSERVVGIGCKTISLADTVGAGKIDLITDVFQTVSRSLPADVECGLHLHATATEAYGKVLAAIDAGCRRFDGAIAGMGGCPFAQNALVGNIPTETIVEAAQKLGLEHGLDTDALADAKVVLHEVWGTSVKELFIAAVLENERMLLELCLSTFNEADTHQRGYLNYEQVAAALTSAYAQLGETASEEKLRAKFEQMDVGHDGRVTFDEMMLFSRQALGRRMKRIWAAEEEEE